MIGQPRPVESGLDPNLILVFVFYSKEFFAQILADPGDGGEGSGLY